VSAFEDGGRRLSAEARGAQFCKVFNMDTGKRRLNCKSRLPVPESIVESDRKEEWPGRGSSYAARHIAVDGAMGAVHAGKAEA
jgi:hypothetical protein